MARWIRHRDSENKRLFHYNALAFYNDCDELLVCLSERSLNIILNALKSVEEMHTRVWTTRRGDFYEMCDINEFEEFQRWMSDLYNQLGSFNMCNEQLTRIAEAIEAIQANTQVMADNTETMVTWQEMLDDLETTLGIGNAFYLLAKAFSDMFPSFANVKISPMPLIQSFWRTKTFEAPLLMAEQAQAGALSGILAAMGASKALDQIKTVIEGFGTLNDYYDNIRDALFGDWNVLDWFGSILSFFIPDGEGGEGGEDPDNDPELRTAVNVAVNVQTPITVNCSNCGGSHNSSCCPIPGGDTPVTEFPEAPQTDEPPREGDPPPGYPSWDDYDTDKCKRIASYLDSYIGTLHNWGGLFGFIGGLTVAVIVGMCLLTVPPVGLAVILASLGLLLTIDTGLMIHFENVAVYLTDHYDELVCELMEDGDTQAMKETIGAFISDAIASLALFEPEVEGNLEAACENLLSNDNLDFIISSDTVPAGYEEYECPCSGDCSTPYTDTITFDVGNETFIEPGVWDIEATIVGGWDYGDAYVISFNTYGGSEFCCQNLTLESGSISGHSYSLCGGSGEGIVSNHPSDPCGTPNTYLDNIFQIVDGGPYRSWIYLSQTPFTVRVTLGQF